MNLFEALSLVIGAVAALAGVAGAAAAWVAIWPRHAAKVLWKAHTHVARMAYWRQEKETHG